MSDEAERLMLFYQEQSNKEWRRIIESKPAEELETEDFVCCDFLSSASRAILLRMLEKNLTSDNQANRYWAAIRLNEYREIDHKIDQVSNGTAWN